jgi:hypothetical protein
MKTLLKNTLILFLFINLSISSQAQHRQRSSSTNARSTSSSSANVFSSKDDCIESGCDCCVYLRRNKIICKTRNANMANISEYWGERENLLVNGQTFEIWNSTDEQEDIISDILGNLPYAYLDALPTHIRIGNPRTGGMRVPEGGRVGGGSLRCHELDEFTTHYEYIIIHPRVFTDSGENPVLTIYHEAGHFIDRHFDIAENLINAGGEEGRTNREHFAEYLASYRGDSRGNDEVIAQGIMYHFQKTYYPRQRRDGTPAPYGSTSRYPRWLLNIIQADIASRE